MFIVLLILQYVFCFTASGVNQAAENAELRCS